MGLPAEEDLSEVAGQILPPHPAVSHLLVDPGGEVAGGVAGEHVGHQEEEIPLQTDGEEPVGEGGTAQVQTVNLLLLCLSVFTWPPTSCWTRSGQ